MISKTIDRATLTGLARQYSATAIKPFWKVKGQSKTFYEFLASFGYDGACLTEFKTTGGYINLHVTYPEKAAPSLLEQVNAARAENARLKGKAVKASTVKRPTVKAAPTKASKTVHRMSIADLNRLADLIAARR